MKRSPVSAVIDAKKLLTAAEKQLDAAVRAAFPIGLIVRHYRGSADGVPCEIVRHAWGDVVVRSLRSGAEYRLSPFWLDGLR